MKESEGRMKIEMKEIKVDMKSEMSESEARMRNEITFSEERIKSVLKPLKSEYFRNLMMLSQEKRQVFG